MTPYVLFFHKIDRTSLSSVGGKGANLGELTKAGFPVPGGFCITTSAYQDFIAISPQMGLFFDDLNEIEAANLPKLREVGERIRSH